MSPPKPAYLFEQAERLIGGAEPQPSPRQEDLRRAISTAYYGVFHFAVTAAANMISVEEIRSSDHYSLVYRSIDHVWVRTLCEEIQKPTIRAKWQSSRRRAALA